MGDFNDDNVFDDYTTVPTAEGLDAVGAAAGGDRPDFHKLETGANTFRLLPRKKGQSNDTPWVLRAVRWLRHGNVQLSVPDRRTILNDESAPCPVSELVESFRASGDPGYLKIAEEAKTKFSFVGAVVPCPGNRPIDPERIAAAVKMIEIGPGVYRDIVALFKNPMAKGNVLYHPVMGFPIDIVKTGSGKDTKYTLVSYAHLQGYVGGSRESALAAVKALPDLDAMAEVPSVEYCQKLCDAFLAKIAQAPAPGGTTVNAGTAMQAAATQAGMAMPRG